VHGSGTGTGYGGNDVKAGDEEGEGILESAVKLAKAAGEKLSAAESEVWRRINGEGST
jgi:tellurite resistance protein